MNRVRLLPENVANQIAAGEVIERPASVVKELVENALDAQASRITVEIQAGGRSLIRVTDDGVGMSRDDALLCLERHATSKITRAEDLAAIATMGFRGEALPSIASVSRFTLTTRERGSASPEGTQIVVSGGRMQEVKAAGTATGTAVEVRQLFFNLPARRKFLRTEETESAHIQHYVALAAMAYPSVAFTFQRDGRLVWQLPATTAGTGQTDQLQALRERLRMLQGGDMNLLPVDFATDIESYEPIEGVPIELTRSTSAFRLWGFLGAPGVSRATRDDQHLFVNRRPVENRGLNYALLEGYHTTLMKGRYPVCCLFLEIDPAAVDVNIHPAKREVKFHRENEVRKLVSQAVRDTLLGYASLPARGSAAATFSAGPEASPTAEKAGSALPARVQIVLPSFPVQLTPPPLDRPATVEQPRLQMGFAPASAPATGAHAEAPALPESTAQSPASGVAAGNVPPSQAGLSTPPPRPNDHGPMPLLNIPLRILGIIGKLYVVMESDRGLVLLDQHAAHERILFEQMLDRMEGDGQAPSQKLLLPETVELSARDAAFLKEQLPTLTRLGVGLSEFGERTFLLDALPPFVKTTAPKKFVLEMIDQIKAAGQEVNTLRVGEHVIAKTVCRHAVKANDPLAGPEVENLVEDLRKCAMPYTCPHGRPTMIEMNFRDLEKKFGRSA